MKQFSQANIVGPSSIALEPREFIHEQGSKNSLSLEYLLNYIVEERKYTIGHSAKSSEYYGPFTKTKIISSKFIEVAETIQSPLLQELKKIEVEFIDRIRKEKLDETSTNR